MYGKRVHTALTFQFMRMQDLCRKLWRVVFYF